MNIVLTGFMATGKTIIGRRLAKELKMEFIDTDSLIEKNEQMKIAEIFSKKGEDYFRKIEKSVINAVSEKCNAVIATGGGAALFAENIRHLKKNGIIICLKSKPEVILERIRLQRGKRPLLNKPDPLKEIKEIYKKRKPFYSKADFFVDTSDFDADKIIKIILKRISSSIHCEKY